MIPFKSLIAPTIVSVGLLVAPSARAGDSNVHCRPSSFDRNEAAFAIVTDRSMGCQLADAWAGAWQAWNNQGAHNGAGAAIDDPAGNTHVLSFDYHDRYIGSFYATYRDLGGKPPILRVQAHGTDRMFVSFETTQ
jgi:hypothetical protein